MTDRCEDGGGGHRAGGEKGKVKVRECVRAGRKESE